MGEMTETSSDNGLSPELDGDRLREQCGVFGIFGHHDAAAITALGLHALQHRGQEAAGIVSFDGKRFHSERRMGLVGDAFSRREVIDRLPGMSAIGVEGCLGSSIIKKRRSSYRGSNGRFRADRMGGPLVPI